VLVEILATMAGATPPAPTKTDLDAWINTYTLPVTTVRDPDNMQFATFNQLGMRRETTLVVDLATMKVLNRIEGSTSGVPPSSTEQAMQIMLSLLGVKSG
jgi:hypothetical protein